MVKDPPLFRGNFERGKALVMTQKVQLKKDLTPLNPCSGIRGSIWVTLLDSGSCTNSKRDNVMSGHLISFSNWVTKKESNKSFSSFKSTLLNMRRGGHPPSVVPLLIGGSYWMICQGVRRNGLLYIPLREGCINLWMYVFRWVPSKNLILKASPDSPGIRFPFSLHNCWHPDIPFT